MIYLNVSNIEAYQNGEQTNSCQPKWKVILEFTAIPAGVGFLILILCYLGIIACRACYNYIETNTQVNFYLI